MEAKHTAMGIIDLAILTSLGLSKPHQPAGSLGLAVGPTTGKLPNRVILPVESVDAKSTITHQAKTAWFARMIS